MSQAAENRIRGIVSAFTGFAGAARTVAAREQQAAEEDRRRVHDQAAGEVAAERSRIEAAVSRAMEGARETGQRAAGALAPGLGSLPFDAPEWEAPRGTGVAEHVRVGTAGPMPLVAPLLGTAGWYVEGEAGDLVRAAVLRMVASSQAGRIQVAAYDPRLGSALGPLGTIGDVLPAAMARGPELHTHLDDLVRTVADRGQRIAQAGSRDFKGLLAHDPRSTEAYRILVLLDYPAGIDEQAQRELLRVADAASGRGVSLIVCADPAPDPRPPESGVSPSALAGLLRRVRVSGGRVTVDGVAEGRADPEPSASHFARVAAAVEAGLSRASLPTIAFAETLPPRSEWWTAAADGLQVTVGLSGRSPAVVRLRSGNPPLPNLLIGGAAGTGKSNLILVLIHGLAARYSPADLEMYLLDFKEGAEFTVLGPRREHGHWLPHARVLGLESDRDFGLAVLRHVHQQIRVRAEQFKRAGKRDIADFPPGPDRPPRILLVMDEFQVMLDGDDAIADEATALIEDLVRRGRSSGIHVVLATQSIEGIQRLASKRDAIFNQVPNRIVLKTSPTDSQSLLAMKNTAAADLRFRGEAIVNDNAGRADANTTALIAHAEESKLNVLRRELWHHAQPPEPPRIFLQGEPADLAALPPAETDGYGLRVWAGVPISVSERPAGFDVRPEPGAGLLVLGDDAPAALGVLSGIALSIAMARPQDRFMVLCPAPDPVVEEGVAALGKAIPIEVIGRDGLSDTLFLLRDRVREGGDGSWTHVLGLGMHRAAGLKASDPDRFEAPADALQEIVKDGPAAGVFCFGWWNVMHACTGHLGFDRCNVGTYLFLDHPVQGVQEICGPLTTWSPKPHRGLLWDGRTARHLVTYKGVPRAGVG